MPEIEISKISLTGWNQRGEESFRGEKFEELKASIKNTGFWENKALLVRPFNGGYQLIAGHRRLKAAEEAGLKKVPVIIEEMTDHEAKIRLFLDNYHHEDLNPLEEAKGIQDLLANDTTQEGLGKKLGKSQAWIANRLRLLQAPKELQELLISGEITPKHVLAVMSLAKYPVFKAVIKNIKDELKKNKTVSVHGIEQILYDLFEGYSDDDEDVTETFVNLARPGYEHSSYMDLANLSDCKKCEHCRAIADMDNQGEVENYCMNKPCFLEKMKAAKEKYDKAQADKLKTLQSKKEVNLANLNYGQYSWFHADNLLPADAKVCKTCSNCKKDKNGSLICLDPACYRKKEAAKSREDTKKVKAEAEAAYKEIDKFTEKKDFYNARGVLRVLADDLSWNTAAKKALKPWANIKDSGKILAAIKGVPDADVEKAIFRLIVFQKLERTCFASVTRKNVEEVLKKYRGK